MMVDCRHHFPQGSSVGAYHCWELVVPEGGHDLLQGFICQRKNSLGKPLHPANDHRIGAANRMLWMVLTLATEASKIFTANYFGRVGPFLVFGHAQQWLESETVTATAISFCLMRKRLTLNRHSTPFCLVHPDPENSPADHKSPFSIC